MRKSFLASALALSLIAGGSTAVIAAQRAVPAYEPGVVLQDSSDRFAGDLDELVRALNEPSTVSYTILKIDDTAGEDKTAYLDRVLQEWGWPAPDTLLLVVFTQENHDIRFAMGSGFRAAGVTVDEILGLLHETYFPTKNQGDPAGALATFIRAVNSRMAPTPQNPVAWVTADKFQQLLTQQNAAAIAQMASSRMTGEPGVSIAPMSKALAGPELAGEQLEGALGAILQGAKPEILAYQPLEDQILLMVKGLNQVEITLPHGESVSITPVVQVALSRGENGAWELLYIATDTDGSFAEKMKLQEWLTLY